MDWIWEYAKQQGALVLVLCFCIYGLIYALKAVVRGDVVARWLYDKEVDEVKAWKTLYEREKSTSEKLLEDRERRERAV